MVVSSCHSTTDQKRHHRSTFPLVQVLFMASIFMNTSCSRSNRHAEEILHGNITYPFYETKPLGTNRKNEKFVLKTAVGNTEYTIEIPGGAEDFDIVVPLESLDSAASGGPDRPRGLSKPNVTDREMLANLPSLEKTDPSGAAFMDKAFGVGQNGGPYQAPSYSLGLAKIVKLYKRKQYEYSLIEINNMLSFYPNSPKLHKMKGTIYAKVRNFAMAEKSWIRALELEPRDRVLRTSILRLQKKIKISTRGSQNTVEKALDIIQPISNPPAEVLTPDEVTPVSQESLP